MKAKILLFSLATFICYSIAWTQTSYGNLIQGSAGNGGGAGSSFFGHQAGLNTTGIGNTFIGYQSGIDNVTGIYNTFLGSQSGQDNTDGIRNTFLGYRSGRFSTTGDDNAFLGYASGQNNDTGSSNTFLGAYSGLNNINGSRNTFIGRSSGYSNIDGSYNNFMGYQSGQNNTTGWYNNFMGHRSGYSNTTGERNTFIGHRSGYENTIGAYNNFIGYDSGYNNENGNENNFIGHQSGFNNQTGSGNVFLGHRAGFNELGSNLLYIDNSDTSAPLIWGDFATDALRFNGTIRITNIPQDNALTRILIADNDGNINWRDDVSLGGGLFPSFPNSAGNGGGNTNAYFGHEAGLVNTGANNTFTGHQSGYNNTTGNQNTANGANALNGNTTGNNNTSMGYNTLVSNTDGENNTAIGSQALLNNTSGYSNVAVGEGGLTTNITGSNNVALGYRALHSNVWGDNNTAIGNNANTSANNLFNTTAIGNEATVNTDNQVRIGNAFVNDIGGYAPWTDLSDGRFKNNIEEDVPGLEFIEKLRPVSYELDRQKLHNFLTGKEAKIPQEAILNERQNGFIAQEVAQIIEEYGYMFAGVKKPRNGQDHYGIKYSKFVVPLVKAVQELSTENEQQKQRIEALQQRIESLENANTDKVTSNLQSKETERIVKGFDLHQNTPNPFHQTTTINAVIPENVQQAKIIVYNLQGLELESYVLHTRGTVSLDISGGRFPSGMYLYALIADNRVIDTKKMILTR